MREVDQQIASRSRLDDLAVEIVRLCEQQASTPVLVTPSYLSLRPAFFVELARQLAKHSQRPVRIDWCRPARRLFAPVADQVDRWRVRRVNRALVSAAGSQPADWARLVLTAAVGRQGGVHRDLVVGWCSNHGDLPAWATPILLAGQPHAAA